MVKGKFGWIISDNFDHNKLTLTGHDSSKMIYGNFSCFQRTKNHVVRLHDIYTGVKISVKNMVLSLSLHLFNLSCGMQGKLRVKI